MRLSENDFMNNVLSTTRSSLLQSMLNVGKDINFSCGYPNFITISDYKGIFDREGVAKRVTTILPEDSWAMRPSIVENEKEETEFEKEWKTLEKNHHIFHYLQRADSLSGIGRFGILLMGVSDGLELSLPVVGIDEKTGKKVGDGKLELLYLRPFDESVVAIQDKEKDPTSPRFGFPTKYSIQFEDSSQLNGTTSSTMTVHWTRVLHLADNRETSEVYGTPRMKPVYNRLLDIRKILSGSGEMFWKGAFPGYAFEINKDIKNPELDKESIRKEFENYSNDLQRYMAIEGVTVKSLTPQVASPGDHLKSQMESIALTIGVPLRIFLGSEQAKLASTQDKDTYNDRLSSRQRYYVTPMIIEPFINRLMAFGVLKETEFTTVWPDLSTPSEKDRADVGEVKTKAIASYVTSNADALIPPREFLTIVLGMSSEEVDVIETAADKWVGLDEPENDEDDDE